MTFEGYLLEGRMGVRTEHVSTGVSDQNDFVFRSVRERLVLGRHRVARRDLVPNRHCRGGPSNRRKEDRERRCDPTKVKSEGRERSGTRKRACRRVGILL